MLRSPERHAFGNLFNYEVLMKCECYYATKAKLRNKIELSLTFH